MLKRRISRIKPQFKVEYIPNVTRYDPILDKNLQNRRVLRKNKIINAKNQIIDRQLTKIVRSGMGSLNNSFKISSIRKPRGTTLEVKKEKERPKTVDRQQFLSYIQKQKQKLTQVIKKKRIYQFQKQDKNTK